MEINEQDNPYPITCRCTEWEDPSAFTQALLEYQAEIERIGGSHTEWISCPDCGGHQLAVVEHTFPWFSYVHTCGFCEYVIMESEWEEVKREVPPV